MAGGPSVALSGRVWIDTDAACGHGPRTDPDDCFAIALLARAPGIEVVGISTVFGNADLAITDSTTRALTAVLRASGWRAPPVYRGAGGRAGHGGAMATPAESALGAALAAGPLTLVALGPLTNVSAALGGRPALRHNVARLVAVMGRRPGHLFHPSEGSGRGMLLGHGPVFRDFNVDQDRGAVDAVLGFRVPTTLVPYDAARGLILDGSDLDTLRRAGGVSGWVATRSSEWLNFWREQVGRDGFYPFDLLAAAYVLSPERFDCAETLVRMAVDERLWRVLPGRAELLAGSEGDTPGARAVPAPAVYCAGVHADLHDWLVEALARPVPDS